MLICSVVSIVWFTIRIVWYETIQVPCDTNHELYRFYSCIVLVSYDTSPNRANHDSIHDMNLPQFENLVFPSTTLPPNWNPNFFTLYFRTLKLINVSVLENMFSSLPLVITSSLFVAVVTQWCGVGCAVLRW